MLGIGCPAPPARPWIHLKRSIGSAAETGELRTRVGDVLPFRRPTLRSRCLPGATNPARLSSFRARDRRSNLPTVSKRRRREKAAQARLGSYEFKKKGISRFDLRDPYHLAITLTWPEYLAALLALYLSANVVFAMLFWLVPGSIANAQPHDFADAFFFSIETIATVGYGEMYPATLYGHVVASTEIVCGVAFTAILTGLTFVRFSRPRAKLVFAANPVVAMHNGKPTLMLQIGNGRPGVLADATAKLNVLISACAAERNRKAA